VSGRLIVFLCLLWPAVIAAQTGSESPEGCARCHVESLTQPGTYMAQALETVENSKVLNEHPLLAVTVGKYSYRIERRGGNESEYTVTDGVNTITLAGSMGDGRQFGIGPDLHPGKRWPIV